MSVVKAIPRTNEFKAIYYTGSNVYDVAKFFHAPVKYFPDTKQLEIYENPNEEKPMGRVYDHMWVFMKDGVLQQMSQSDFTAKYYTEVV